MDILRIGLWAAGLAVVLGGSLVSRQPEPSAVSASFAVDAAATPVADQGAAQVSDLQTRVADLSTRVAELGGAEEPVALLRGDDVHLGVGASSAVGHAPILATARQVRSGAG